MTETPKTPAKAPVARKAPQDRRPKAAAVVEPETYAATAFGNEWSVSADALDDAELLDELNELNKGNAMPVLSVLRRTLGDQYTEAMDSIRDDNGKLKASTAAEFFRELFDSMQV